MAVVSLAQDERLDRKVAVKVLAPELALDAAFRARLLDRGRAAAEINHPHTLPVHEADDAAGIVYIVMRYARGGGLGFVPSVSCPTARAATGDIVDACVVEGALRRRDLAVSSDEDDLQAIAGAVSRRLEVGRP
jgi:hypothetical protein